MITADPKNLEVLVLIGGLLCSISFFFGYVLGVYTARRVD